MPNIKLVSTTPGTPIPFSSVQLNVWQFVAQALRANADVIAIGGPDSNATTEVGLILAPGDAFNYDPIQQFYKLERFWFDVKVSGSGINIVYPD